RAPADHALYALTLDGAQLLDVRHSRETARGDHRNAQRLGQFDGGVHVDAGQHAIAADVGVDHGLHAPILELACQVNHLVTRELAPAIGRDLAILGVEPDDDVPAERAAGILQE